MDARRACGASSLARGKRPVSPVGPLPQPRSHPSGRCERRPRMSGAAANFLMLAEVLL